MPAKEFTHWAAGLRERADQSPVLPRQALLLDEPGCRIGSIEAALARRLCDAGLPLRASGPGWQVTGSPDASLAEIAHWLHVRGLGGRWRNELLAVTDDAGRAIAAIERSAARPLGIATQAVHLVGGAADASVWVQQRALDKATDPGLWDTLIGGLISAAESIHDTLARETWEEAGLHLPELQSVAGFGRLTVRRPVAEGYMVEHIHMFEGVVPEGVSPVNQDGEVAKFERIDLAELRQRLQRNNFTLEAALILLLWLEHRGMA